MAFWRIELFGGLRIVHDGQEVPRLRTRRAASLVAYLAYHCPRRFSREELAEMLWPDAEPGAGRQSLRQALLSLRSQLEPPGAGPGSVIMADRSSIALSADAVETDVVEFEAATAALRRGSGDWVASALRTADLYRGELLTGFYDEWIFTERRRLADLFISVMDRLGCHLEESGDLAGALDVARRVVAADPLREEAHREVIRLYGRMGRAEDAARQYRELKRLLARDLGEAPSGVTRALAARITRTLAGQGRVESPASPDPGERTVGALTLLLATFPPGMASERICQEMRTHGACEVHVDAGHTLGLFPRACDAVACALSCHHEEIRVALHIGETDPAGRAPTPIASHSHEARRTLERVAGAMHSGQVLATEEAAVLARRRLPEEAWLEPLGSYRLGEEERPIRLFQLRHPDLPDGFAPLRAEPAFAGSLPPQATRFFGRTSETDRLRRLLVEERARLVTLTGAGGNGKTRLALHAAAEVLDAFGGAVWFVPLADVSDASLIPEAIREALALPSQPGRQALDQVVEVLAERPALLVLDNLEQLAVTGASFVAGLLARAPLLCCLVTSRVLLGIPGEQRLAVEPLPVPNLTDALEALARCPSVSLFVDRAQAVRPDFQVTWGNAPALAELCRRLEGIPLALELVVARMQTHTPAQILAQLGERLDWEGRRGTLATERHRSLRAAIEWSYRLLSPGLQRFFARLSLFRGGWDTGAAQSICAEEAGSAAEALWQLQAHSLIVGEQAGEAMRFRMLETLREFAAERLAESGEEMAGRRRHAEHFLALAEEARGKLDGPEQAAWLRRLAVEQENLRMALGWAGRAEPERQMRLVAALHGFWMVYGGHAEGYRWGVETLGAAPDAPPALRARVLQSTGILAFHIGEVRSSHRLLEESLECFRTLGDHRGRARVLADLGDVTRFAGGEAVTRACDILREATVLLRETGDEERVGYSLALLSGTLPMLGTGHLDEAERACRESLEIHRRLGNQARVADSLGCLAQIAMNRSPKESLALGLESYRTAARVNYQRGMVTACLWLGYTTLCTGDLVAARRWLTTNLRIACSAGFPVGVAFSLEGHGCLSAAEGQYRTAAQLLGAAQALAVRAVAPLRGYRPLQSAYEQTVAAARAALGDEGYERAHAEGQAMPEEDAIALALEGAEPEAC